MEIGLASPGSEGGVSPPGRRPLESCLSGKRLDQSQSSRLARRPGLVMSSSGNRLDHSSSPASPSRPALAIGCLCFVLVGCPVGIWISRSDYLSAFITCFLPIVVFYYPLLLCGISLSKTGRVEPVLALWTPNLLMAVIAIPLGMLIGHTGKGTFLVVTGVNSLRALPTLGVLLLGVLSLLLRLLLALPVLSDRAARL